MALASNSTLSTSNQKEYRVKLANVGDKNFNIMRFKPPHTIDLQQLTNPVLDRKEMHTAEEEKPEYGEGSEFGRKMRDEARRKKKGINIRKAHPDDQPWVLREHKKGGKHFVGRKEGGINSSSSYYLFSFGQDGVCEAVPVSNWYDFVPPVKYKYLNDDEAEERFEKRNKTLNYFSIMVSKRIKDQDGEEAEVEEKSKSGRKKKTTVALMESESDEFSSVDSDDEDDRAKKKSSKKRKGSHKKRPQHDDSEAGEETDEGDMESREVDYFTDTSSDSEEEKAKEAVKNEPRDDAEVERKEEKDIDHVFVESSSESEDDQLTDSGKALKALIQKQVNESSAGEVYEDEEMETEATTAAGDSTIGASQSSSSSSSSSTPHPTPTKQTGVKREHETDTGSSSPPTKRTKEEVSPSSITPQEIRKYLDRRPMMPKDLVKKFVKIKSGMDKKQVVAELGHLLKMMQDVEKQDIKGKMHLSLCRTVAVNSSMSSS